MNMNKALINTTHEPTSAEGGENLMRARGVDTSEPVQSADAQEFSVFKALKRLRGVWLPPLAAEVVLMVMAAHMSLAFGRIMRGDTHQGDWLWVAFTAVVFVALRSYAKWSELFMPRMVAFLGMGLLVFIAAVMLAGLVSPTPWHAAFDGVTLQYRLLAGLPLVLFVAREIGIVADTRFSPSLEEMSRRRFPSARPWTGLIRRLEFWMR
jgi:hypothetical protein